MKTKVEIDTVKFILRRNQIEGRTVARVMEDIEAELKMEAEESAAPAIKKQFVVLVSDPQGHLAGVDLDAWVLQIPEEDGVHTTEERLIRGAYDFNATPKGRRMPARTVGEACEVVPPRIFKEHNVWVKTKEPVLVVRTNNKIPFDREG